MVLLTWGTRGQIVPCDMLLLEGTAVVNEAVLTGESTPQIKESIQRRPADEALSIKQNKGHILFGGTEILTCSRAEGKGSRFGPGPCDGCVGFVLRTGFETAQGKLVRTIVHSASRVSANSKEVLPVAARAAFVACKGLGPPGGSTRSPPPPPPGMHYKGRDLRGGPRSGQIGSWRRLAKRLGAVTVGYKCH